MLDFWAVLFSPTAINKFLHTITSAYVLASVFVIGISAWFLLKNRQTLFAKRSMLVASVFGLIASLYLAFTGDGSARQVVLTQPMKLAAMEGLYHGKENAPLVVFGALGEQPPVEKTEDEGFLFRIEIPGLSYLAYRDSSAFVPGIYDLVHGNAERNIPAYPEKIAQGKLAIQALKDFKAAQKAGDDAQAQAALKVFEAKRSSPCFFASRYAAIIPSHRDPS
jgi:cytochrome d ubiquinol oxidase subunit I